MKKLLIAIITIIIVLFLPACSLSSSSTSSNSNVSTNTSSTTESINQDYVFTSMSQEIIVTSASGEVLSSVKKMFTPNTTGGYDLTKTTMTLNEIDSSADSAFTTTTTVTEAEELDLYIFATSDFSASDISTNGLNKSLTGTLSSTGIKNIGLAVSEYLGDVEIVIENYNNKLTLVAISYMSSSGNTVTITTQLT